MGSSDTIHVRTIGQGRHMQRDWALIREILAVASSKAPGEKMLHTEVSGHFLMLVGDHIAALNDAGCLKALVIRAHGYVMWAAVTEMTAEGWELLDTLNCSQTWHRVVELAKKKELSFEFVRRMGGFRTWNSGVEANI